MLTVLCKHRDTGREVLFEAASVEFQNAPCQGAVPDPGAGLLLNLADGSQSHFEMSQTVEDVRDIFVMNDHGKTVARYAL